MVWAKVTGHSHPAPAWPARVTKVMEKKGLDLHYRVTLYMIKGWAVLQEEELCGLTLSTLSKSFP